MVRPADDDAMSRDMGGADAQAGRGLGGGNTMSDVIEGAFATLLSIADRHPENGEAARIRICVRLLRERVQALEASNAR
jgi:hypothetical protein